MSTVRCTVDEEGCTKAGGELSYQYTRLGLRQMPELSSCMAIDESQPLQPMKQNFGRKKAPKAQKDRIVFCAFCASLRLNSVIDSEALARFRGPNCGRGSTPR